MDEGLGSSSLVGRQLGALAWKGAWEGQSPSCKEHFWGR